MKLLQVAAPALAASVLADGHGDHGEDHMDHVEEPTMVEEPWYTMLEPYGLEVTDDGMKFEMEEPAIKFETKNHGNYFSLKTPWYTRKYEIDANEEKEKFEFSFKETVPGYSIVNKLDMAQKKFDKNLKTPIPGCQSEKKSDCETKEKIGDQHKFEFAAEHKNEGGKFKVYETSKFQTNLMGYPTQMDVANGWKFENKMPQAEEGMEMMEGMEMVMDDEMTEMMEENMQAMPMLNQGDQVMSMVWDYDLFPGNNVWPEEPVWVKTQWSFDGAYKMDEDVSEMTVTGFQELMDMNISEQGVLTMRTAYGTDAGDMWSNRGESMLSMENFEGCMKIMGLMMNGEWDEFFNGVLEEPCVMTMANQGSSEWMDMETGEMMNETYQWGMSHEAASFTDQAWAWMNSETGEMEECFRISTDRPEVMEIEDMSEETEIADYESMEEMEWDLSQMKSGNVYHISMMNTPMISFDCDLMIEQEMREQEMFAKFGFMMWKKWEHMQTMCANMDWTDETEVRTAVAKFLNMDYIVNLMGEKERELVRMIQEYECSNPKWEMMADMGIIVQPALQSMAYQHANYELGMMQLAQDVQYWEMVYLVQFFYSNDGSMMSAMDFYRELMSLEYHNQYRLVAEKMESGEWGIYVSDMEMIYTALEMTPTECEKYDVDMQEAAREAFMEMLPTTEQLYDMADYIESYEADQMSNEEVDATLNQMCNTKFEAVLEWHQAQYDMEVASITDCREDIQMKLTMAADLVNTDRQVALDAFDAEIAYVESRMENEWECEYMYWGAPVWQRVAREDLEADCLQHIEVVEAAYAAAMEAAQIAEESHDDDHMHMCAEEQW